MTGKVRIIGGQWRGRKLEVPGLPGLRPSGDRSRETLFNWLQDRLHGARCLDLFAGTGALGLEAASRGAASVCLVERDRGLCEALRSIARNWPGGDRLDVIQADAAAWLERAGGPYDLIFIDPPFDAGLHRVVLGALSRPGLLAPGARVYVESSARSEAPIPANAKTNAEAEAEYVGSAGHWQVLREKRLGEVRMQLLIQADAGDGARPAAAEPPSV